MTERDRRALVLGAVVIGFVWVTTRGAPGARAWIEEEQRTAEQAGLRLDQAYQRLGRLPALDDSIVRLETVAEAMASRLLIGQDEETAAIALAARVRTVVDGPRVSLEAFGRPSGETGPAELAQVRVPVVVQTDLLGLLDFLRRVDGDPALGVDQLALTAADPHAPAEAPETLRATVIIRGWFRAAEQARPNTGAFSR